MGYGDSSFFFQMKGHAFRPFPRGDNKIAKNALKKLKTLTENNWANLNQTWHKTSMGKMDLSFYK